MLLAAILPRVVFIPAKSGLLGARLTVVEVLSYFRVSVWGKYFSLAYFAGQWIRKAQ